MSSRPLHESRDEKTLFLEALDIEDAAERRAFLDEACSGDEDLRRNLEDLLRIEDAGRSEILEPSSYQSLREGQESFAEVLEEEERFLENLGTQIRTLGDYDLLDELGRGAMGVVFRARQRSLNREVAIKILVGSSLASQTERQRFQLEAEAAASLRHPNIVPILEYGRIEDHEFFTMPVLAGGTLADLMEREREDAPLNEAVRLMIKVAGAVQAAHERGILHRDLKPQNVLLDEHQEPHVSDFGLACRLEQAGNLTVSGQIMGTPQYMAPEQAEGGNAPMTTAVDIHSLGAILYELLAGIPAFRADSVLKTLQLVKEQIPRSPRSLRPGIDRDLETITLKCLEKEPARRYHSVGTLRDDLSAWLEHRPIAARPPGRLERAVLWVRRRPLHAALALTISLLLLALGIGGPLAAVKQAYLREQAESESRRADLLRERAEEATEAAEAEAERNRQNVYYSEMNRLGLAMTELGTYPVIQELLQKWIPEPGSKKRDLRDWEWYLLAAFAEQSDQTFEVGRSFHSLRLDPDCSLVAIPVGKNVRIYSTRKSEVVRTLEGESGIVHSVEWSPDGSRLATGSMDGSIALWDVDSGTIIKQARSVHGRGRTMVDWSPDGGRLVSAGADNRVRLWDGASLEEQGDSENQKAGTKGLLGLSWSSSGNQIAFWQNRYFEILSADEPGRPILQSPPESGGPIVVAWNPVSDQLATGGTDRTISIWDLRGGEAKTVKQLPGQVGAILALAWSPDGMRLASGSNARELKIWDVERGVVVDELPGQSDPVHLLDWGSDDRTLAVGDAAGVVKIWDLDRNRVPRALREFEGPLIAARVSPDGEMVATCAGSDRVVSIVDLETGEERRRIPMQKQPGSGERMCWRPDGQQFAFLTDWRNVCVLDHESGAKVFLRTPSAIVGIEWDPVRAEFLAAHLQGGIQIWDWAGETALRTLQLGPEDDLHSCVSWSPDGTRILCSGKGKLSLWPAEGGEALFAHSLPTGTGEFLTTHGWHPGGTHVAVGSRKGIIHLWNVERGSEERVLKGHTGEILQICWHPDGTRLASASADHTIKIWDPASGEAVLTLRGHATDVKSIQWIAAGKALVSAGADGTVLSWDASRAYRSFKLKP